MIQERNQGIIDPTSVGITIREATFENAKLFDHLTQRLQSLLVEAKKVQARYKWKYCWAKESAIYLREFDQSTIYCIKNANYLAKFTEIVSRSQVDY